jgi:hypothetical protein
MKSETRNSKLETSSKLEIGPAFLRFSNSVACDSIFEFASNFELRISNFAP